MDFASHLLSLFLLWMAGPASAQFEGTLDAAQSLLPGVKNILGGILAADNIHSNCIQKILCDELSNEVVEVKAKEDPVKRSLVHVPVVVQKKGLLRQVVDNLAQRAFGFMDRMNPFGRRYRTALQRRQGVEAAVLAAKPTLAAVGLSFLRAAVDRIPLASVLQMMDFAADVTNTFDRKGSIYPFMRAGLAGYNFGHRRSDDLPNGVCELISKDCNGGWSQLKVINNYDGGTLSRRNSALGSKGIERDGLAPDSVESLQWNQMEVNDIFKPRIFLCKMGRFFRNLNYQMGGQGPPKGDTFGGSDFQSTCHPDDFRDDASSQTDTAVQDAVPEGGTVSEEDEAVIVEAAAERSSNDTAVEVPRIAPILDKMVPLVLIEGLPELKDEDYLMSLNLTEDSIVQVVRLPGQQALVELDSLDHLDQVVSSQYPEAEDAEVPLAKEPKIRAADSKDLWDIVQQLSKRIAEQNHHPNVPR